MDKMIDAQSIIVASTATRWYGHEGDILRYVFSQCRARGAGRDSCSATSLRIYADGGALIFDRCYTRGTLSVAKFKRYAQIE